MAVNTKHIKQCILLAFMLLILLFLFSINIKMSYSKKDELSCFRLSSNDGNICVTWNNLSVFSVKNIEITIIGPDVQETVIQNPLYGSSYKFEKGIHGNLYMISAHLNYRDGTVSETQEKQAIFLDYSLLPNDIPLLQITTKNYENPTADEAEKPDNLWGALL